MEFRFRYTVWERVYYVFRETLQILFRFKLVLLCFLGAAWFLAGLLPDLMLFVLGDREGFYGALFSLLGIILLFLVLVVLFFLISLASIWKNLSEERWICIKDGVIFAGAKENKLTAEYLCKTVQSVKVSGSLIWLELPFTRKSSQYLLIPTRELGSLSEQERFLAYFQQQQNTEPILAPRATRQIQPADWHVAFDLSFDAWMFVNAQILDVKQRRLLKPSRIHNFPIMLVLIIVIGSYAMGVLQGESIDVVKLIYLAVLTGVIYRIILHQPVREDSLRRQHKWGLMREDMIGSWELFFSEEGIDYVSPAATGGTMMWNQVKWLAESDDCFFLFTPQKQVPFFFEKALLGGNNQRQDFVAYCQEHGLEYRRIRPKVEKKSSTSIIIFIKTLVKVTGIAVMMIVGLYVINYSRSPEVPQETRTSFVFRPKCITTGLT